MSHSQWKADVASRAILLYREFACTILVGPDANRGFSVLGEHACQGGTVTFTLGILVAVVLLEILIIGTLWKTASSLDRIIALQEQANDDLRNFMKCQIDAINGHSALQEEQLENITSKLEIIRSNLVEKPVDSK